MKKTLVVALTGMIVALLLCAWLSFGFASIPTEWIPWLCCFGTLGVLVFGIFTTIFAIQKANK